MLSHAQHGFFGDFRLCMSGHAQASVTNLPAIQSDKALPLGCLGNTCVDMGSPRFKGHPRTDFRWFIADMDPSPPDPLN